MLSLGAAAEREDRRTIIGDMTFVIRNALRTEIIHQ